MSFALSTSWNAFKFSEGEGIIREIKETGFDRVELSFSLSAKITKDILSLSKKDKIKVVSLHNFCPIPDGLTREIALPDYYSLASTNEAERKTAVHFTKKSIDSCFKFNAQALVLHSGRMDMEDNTQDLIQLCRAGFKDGPQYNALKDSMQKRRDALAKSHLSQLIKSLEELSRYSQKSGIALGIENRFYFREIPNLEEIGIILRHFNNCNVFYWHDMGHAHIMETLGFVHSAYDFLKQYASRLIGLHLHDVQGCRDHLAPLRGNLDFSRLKPYIKDSTLKVIEAHYPARPEEIIKGKLHLEKVLG